MLNITNLSVNVDVFKWIIIGSTLFKADITIILLRCPSGLHQFGRVVNIIRYLEKFMFVCEMLNTVSFDEHFQAFKVNKRRDQIPYCFVFRKFK